jgi:hypothetical protein
MASWTFPKVDINRTDENNVIMARIDLTADALTVRFSTVERIFGLLNDISVPRSAVTSVSVEPSGLAAVRGLRAPGLGLPGRRKIGTWRGTGDLKRRTAVSVRTGEPAVRITLTGTRWDQLVIGTCEADRLVQALGGTTT